MIPLDDTPILSAVEQWTPAVAQEWDALALRVGATPFVRPGWIAVVLEAFYPDRSVTLVTARRGGELTGVLPVVATHAKALSPTAAGHTPLFVPIAVDAPSMQSLGCQLCRLQARSFVLKCVDQDALVALDAAAKGAGLHTFSRLLSRSPFVDVDRSWEAYQQRFTTHERRNNRRRWRRLADEGTVEWRLEDGTCDLDLLLGEGLAVEAESWKGRAGTAIVNDPTLHGFYSRVARWGRDAGLLRLAFLRVAGRPVGFVFLLAQGHTFYALKTAYDPVVGNCAPGMLNMLALIEHACADPTIATVELLGEEEPWKAQLAEGARPRYTWHGHRNRLAAEAAAGRVATAEATKSWAKSRIPRETWLRARGVAGRLSR